MNQILDFGAGNGDNGGKPNKNNKFGGNENFGGKNNFNGGKKNGGGKTPLSDKIIKVFALLMIILAIALIASGVISLLKNKKEEADNKTAKTSESSKESAEITADLDEISGKVKITVNSKIAISKMIYSWDEEHDNVVSGEKQTSLEEEVVAPYGKHVLHVQVTDEKNNKTNKEFTFDSATGIDTTQPKITLSVTEDKKLLVTSTDDTSIAYVTYTWNEEETVTMTPEEEGTKEFEFELDIPRGKNTIVVFAVDGSESSNAKTVSKVLEGVTKPEISYGFLDQEGKVLQITCTHETGIKSIHYTFNGQDYQWEAEEGAEPQTELTFTQESVPGHNVMTITVTSVEDTEAEFNPEWDYGQAEEQTQEQTPDSEDEGETTTEDTEDVVSEESENN